MDQAVLLQYTISGLMPLLSISLTGAFLAWKKIFTRQTVKQITSAYSSFFNPLFISMTVAKSVDISNIGIIWPLLLTPSLMVLVGLLISYTHSMFFTTIPHISRLVQSVLTFSSAGNVVFILMKGICSPYGPLKGNPNCKDAYSYISLQILTYSALLWSYGYTLIEKDQHEYLDHLENQALLAQGKCRNTAQKYSMWKNVIKNLFTPTPIACVFGIIFGVIPGVQSFVFNEAALHYSVIEILMEFSFAGVVVGQVSLGTNIVLLERPKKNGISNGFVASIVLFKCFVTPVVSIGIVYLFWELNVFGENLVVAYVVFISFCAPTAIVIMVISENIGYGSQEITWLMLWIYVFAVPSLISSTYLFFFIFK